MKQLGGRILFLDRDDINTDEIIPAKYLNEDSKAALGPFCLEDLSLAGFDRKADLPGKRVILSRANFGCGSSREHAPWAFEANGINVVIAESFARIFRQNMFNCGMLAAELPGKIPRWTIPPFRRIGRRLGGASTIDGGELEFQSPADGGAGVVVPLTIGAFEVAMVRAGGWVQFAAERY